MSKDIPFILYSKYYDLLYKDKNYFEEAEYINDFLVKNNLLKSKILELGSGTGIHANWLSKKGHKILGIEQSKDMVSIAKHSKSFTSKVGDIRKIKTPTDFDAVISIFHVMSYMTTDHDLNLVFKNASNALKKGGIFLFDFWYKPAVRHQKLELRIKRMKSKNLEVLRIAEPKNNSKKSLAEIKFTIISKDLETNKIHLFDEVHRMRYLNLNEIDLFAKKNKLRRINAEEFLTKKSPSIKTWGVCVALQKI